MYEKKKQIYVTVCLPTSIALLLRWAFLFADFIVDSLVLRFTLCVVLCLTLVVILCLVLCPGLSPEKANRYKRTNPWIV